MSRNGPLAPPAPRAHHVGMKQGEFSSSEAHSLRIEARSVSGAGPLRVALVLPYYDPARSDDPATMLERQPTLSGIAEAAANRGLTVGAFQLFRHDARLQRGRAEFRFVASPAGVQIAARWMHRAFPRYQPPYYEPALALLRQVEPWQPDVLHAFGLTLDLNLLLVSQLARRRRKPLVVHYHGGLPDADRLTTSLRRRSLAATSRVLFTSREQAEPWLRSGLLTDARKVVEVMETSTHLRPLPQAAARASTGMHGDPACLMVGRLQASKDPLTALTGFALVAEQRPAARLVVVTQQDDLRPQLEAVVGAVPGLAGRVRFVGHVPHAAMAAVYTSADFLLHASRREWSGLAVLEAMACGCIPVLSDIPPFRRMTADGRYGRLFPPGDAAALARNVLAIPDHQRVVLSCEVRGHFQRALSFSALARDLEEVYREVLVAP